MTAMKAETQNETGRCHKRRASSVPETWASEKRKTGMQRSQARKWRGDDRQMNQPSPGANHRFLRYSFACEEAAEDRA